MKFFKPEDFLNTDLDLNRVEISIANIANAKRDKALEEAFKICKKGAKFGIDECVEWMKKYGGE